MIKKKKQAWWQKQQVLHSTLPWPKDVAEKQKKIIVTSGTNQNLNTLIPIKNLIFPSSKIQNQPFSFTYSPKHTPRLLPSHIPNKGRKNKPPPSLQSV